MVKTEIMQLRRQSIFWNFLRFSISKSISATMSIVSFNQGFNDIPFEVNFVEYNNIYENSVKFTCNFEV